MKNTRVYDLPTRLFHWMFAFSFLAAFIITKTIDDDSPYFSYHMILGLILSVLVVMRIFWGFFGSRYARFSSFILNPSKLIHYFQQLFLGKTERTLGHNPASSWVAMIMFGLALGLGVTGFLMTSGGVDKEILEDVHDVLANAFIIAVVGHIAGLVFHTIRHREWIGSSMIHGKKGSVEGQVGIDHPHRGAAIAFVILLSALIYHLGNNYDSDTQRLNLFGTILHLGDSENHSDASLRSVHDDDDD